MAKDGQVLRGPTKVPHPNWRERIEFAKSARAAGKKACEGKPTTFSMRRSSLH